MSDTRRGWDFDEGCTDVRTAFLRCPTDRLSDGTFVVGESGGLDWDAGDDQETAVDPEVEHEIGSIIAGLLPIEESGAVEVLATWRQTRTAMTQKKLIRGLRPEACPYRSDSNKVAGGGGGRGRGWTKWSCSA